MCEAEGKGRYRGSVCETVTKGRGREIMCVCAETKGEVETSCGCI